MDWAFIWMMFALKVPVFMLLGLVWWAIRSVDDQAGSETGEGGSKRPRHPRPRPWRPRRRGPHGEPAAPAPPRVRSVRVTARNVDKA